ncbi:Rieske (2Fe-2S) protein [Pseudonocardia parietis]|uniref:Nitrite reductase/ring-hydroxylating ferredoxin subunit n=1 Tax=Pseudonocardia parietis TaxID=570936 RepID=A0ABS4VQM9_9PSEU|nr:Rieske (2Fe-2S) protein [Pseudonocardia parietis]MBP2366217.1 nitrite reductase/ring-hydroxylating ferredoxin subunit [Pseudonocardia parietis]
MTETTSQAPHRAVPRGTPHVICRADELPPGTRKIVEIDGTSIGVLNVDGRFHALRNQCPHHGAPLCQGAVRGTMADTAPHEYSYGQHNEWIACPWHGFEFRLETGRPLLSTERARVRVYPVVVDDGDVVLYV